MTPRFVIESARLAGPPLLRCQTDGRLVDLVRAGNDRAFEAIVDRYQGPLLRYCAGLLPQARAEDAIQQTFLNAYAAMQRGDADLELRPWLYRIARNACLNALRESGWSHEQIENLRRGTESAQEVAERRSELRQMVAAVHTLPTRQREAVVLRELEGRTYDQIARELDSSEGAVRQLLNRARHTLRAGATALTPLALLARMSWANNQPVVAHVTEAAGHEAVRSGAALGGAVAAAIAIAAGVSEAPRLHSLTVSAPPAPAGDLTASSAPRSTAKAIPQWTPPEFVLRGAGPIAAPRTDRAGAVRGTGLATPSPVVPAAAEPSRHGGAGDDGDGDRGRGVARGRGGSRELPDDLSAREGWRRRTPNPVSWTPDRGRDREDGERSRTGRGPTAAIARHRPGADARHAGDRGEHKAASRRSKADRPGPKSDRRDGQTDRADRKTDRADHDADRPQKQRGESKGKKRKGKKG